MTFRAGVVLSTVLLTGGLAHGADLLPRRAVPVAAAPILGWEGFYTGFDVSYMDTRAQVREAFARGRYNLTGYGGGSFIGYNWQFGSVVAGVEGIISIHETKGDLRRGPTTGAQGDQLWSAGVRGRLGYSFGAFLPYISGGYATTEFHQHSPVLFQDGQINRHDGFTVGAGLEYAFTRHISARVEYEYAHFDPKTYVHDGIGHRVSLEGHSIKGALILREGRGGPSESFLSGILPPGRGYGGVLVGYGFGESDFQRQRGGRTRVDVEGVEGGIFGGYDFLFGNGTFVGYDSFVNISDIGGRNTGPGGTIDVQLLWTGATRARAGVTYGAVSPFLAAGFALAQERTVSVASGALSNEMHYGGTVGAGLDIALGERWFTRAEYAYTAYMSNKPKVDLTINKLTTDHHEVRFGLGYKL